MADYNIIWDKEGEKLYETGVSRGVLYPMNADAEYEAGEAWNGLTQVSESPSGAEATKLYADDDQYLNLVSKEEFGATVEAYMYPESFAECDGTANIEDGLTGITVGQQPRKSFGLCYTTRVGNDVVGDTYGEKIHFIYNAKATPSEKSYATVNDSPEAITFSWTLTTTPIDMPNGRSKAATIVIDTTKLSKEMLAKIPGFKEIIYGKGDTKARLPLPAEILDYFKDSTSDVTE